jgi:hypothetical protein
MDSDGQGSDDAKLVTPTGAGVAGQFITTTNDLFNKSVISVGGVAHLDRSGASTQNSDDFLAPARGQIDPADLSSKAGIRFLVGDRDRLIKENKDLTVFRDECGRLREQVSVLEVTLDAATESRTRDEVLLAASAAGIGFAPSYISLDWRLGIALMAIFLVFLLMIIFSKKGARSKVRQQSRTVKGS